MPHVTLTRKSHKPARGLAFLADLPLAPARSHEFCGPARHALAMILAGANSGPVFWIAPGWGTARLHAPGMLPFADPARFIFVQANRPEDALWSMEETLRAGTVPLVVAELDQPCALTPIRRLHLAAEHGAALSTIAPTAVLLTPEGGSQGIETRWHIAPTHHPGKDRWTLTRQRARSAPPQSWTVTRGDKGYVVRAVHITEPETDVSPNASRDIEHSEAIKP